MPRLAVFPKAFMTALCKTGTMTISEWIDLAGRLGVDGLEWYAGFMEMSDAAAWPSFRRQTERLGMVIPMMCCSPDFTHPDVHFRQREVKKQKRWIDMAHTLGASYCRVLSGQGRPGVTIEQGLTWAAGCIEACLPHARSLGITLVLENHYKDDFWQYPEFALRGDVFCRLVDRIHDPGFGVNYDPSNTYLAGEDPIPLLERVVDRVVTMHASDRYLKAGTLEDLRREETGAEGYAARLCHGEIGKGLNDYDAIFSLLAAHGFDGWISIEDGVEGMEQLARSVSFVRKKIDRYWPSPS